MIIGKNMAKAKTSSSEESPLDERLRLLAKWISDSKRLVIFTGAGISTDSGLPDFRGPDGVWTRRDKGLPPPKWKVRPDDIRPNASHLAIVELYKLGKLDFLISQNVDGLHLVSGIPQEILVELHGNGRLMKCLICDKRFAKEKIGWDEDKWGPGYRTSPPIKGQPYCPDCGGRIISAVINFGDPMPEKEMELAEAHSKKCDLFLVLGASLVVQPAANMPVHAYKAKAKLVIVNQGDTPLDKIAHLRFREGILEVMPNVVECVKRLLKAS
jgi:NAD-dependent SIR2 family protein deacetylase